MDGFLKTRLDYKQTLKDLNFIEISHDLKYLLVELTEEQQEFLLKIIQSDSEFLMRHGIMDYSLLLTVESKKEHVKETFIDGYSQNYGINFD